jgi:SAM-dependent methyltransferase
MKRILNAGCGNDTYGTDFTDKYPQRKEVKKCDQDRNKIPFPDNTFDEVVFQGVAEHLRNVGFAMEEIYRVLKPDGKFFLSTDNANYFGWSVGKTHLGGYNSASIFGDKNKHFSLFTSFHLEEHAKAVGFRNIKVKYVIFPAKGRWLEKEFGVRHMARLVVKFILDRTPLWRMGYPRLEMRALK